MYEAIGLPRGMIEGTDVTNFTVNAGGWRCRHRLIPAPNAVVPEEVKKKLEEKSNFAAKPENKMDKELSAKIEANRKEYERIKKDDD